MELSHLREKNVRKQVSESEKCSGFETFDVNDHIEMEVNCTFSVEVKSLQSELPMFQFWTANTYI